jgi:hypothetical protein
MGLGLLPTELVNDLSGWNQRTQCFLIGGVICSAAMTVLWLQRRLSGSLQWHDVPPILMILSMQQFEIYAGSPSLSHGALPILLIMLMAIAWTQERIRLRYACVLIINFLSIYTGYGVFVGILTPLLLIIDCCRAVKNRDLRRVTLALPAAGISLVSIRYFFIITGFSWLHQSLGI